VTESRKTDSTAPVGSSDDRTGTELGPEEEPVTTGTLFLTMIILMVIAGIWIIVYGLLLDR
jgi:hypothetical protein